MIALEPRLVKRYEQLVRSHMASNDLISPGIKNTLSINYAFAQTQAAWRFLNNDKCTLDKLMQPILVSALEQSKNLCSNYALVAHDWSGLSYKTHTSKVDRHGIHNNEELGYELQSSLLLSDTNGSPIAPIAINLTTKNEVLSTYRKDISKEETHLEELVKRIEYIDNCGFEKQLIHIVDREADSAQLIRALRDKKWLFRCRKNSLVEYNKTSVRVDKLSTQLTFTKLRNINYKGIKAKQYLSEASVHITRISQPKKRLDGKKQRIKGESVPARLIASKVCDLNGNILAWWYLLTNVNDVCIGDIALWYYWRWSIESFFKLLKSAGMQSESWQQESGTAIARRLLIACMSCVFIWQIAEAKSPEAGEIRKILTRLSGRQMRYGKEFTRAALLAGFYSLLNMFDLLNTYDVDDLKKMLKKVIGDRLV